MTTGTSILRYLEQSESATPFAQNNCYFQIRLHSVYTYVEAGWLQQIGQLVCATLLNSTFAPEHRSGGIYRVTEVRRNTPTLLSLSVNLTDWLPAVSEHAVKLELQLLATLGNPFGQLQSAMRDLGLTSRLGLVSPELAVGIKVADITAQIMGVLLRENSQRELIPLQIDLNVQSLKTGLYAVLQPYHASAIPNALELKANGMLGDPNGHIPERINYVVFEVAVMERRGEEAARGLPWWEALQDARMQITGMPCNDDDDRREIHVAWRKALLSAERLAQQDRSFLLVELHELLQKATKDVKRALTETTLFESTGTDVFPDSMRAALGVATMAELEQSVAAYEQALERSRQQRVSEEQFKG